VDRFAGKSPNNLLKWKLASMKARQCRSTERSGPLSRCSMSSTNCGAHGVGRIDLVENAGGHQVGGDMKRAARCWLTAHRELETLCLDRETAHYSEMLSLR